MTILRFRNIDPDPQGPLETWPPEGIQAALERGNLSDYRRLVAAIRRDPWGDVARRVEHVLTYVQPYGATALLQQAIVRHRTAAQARVKQDVADLLRAALAQSGLTQAQFASRLGTSASRMSTYLNATVTPSASVLVRAQQLAASVRAAHTAADPASPATVTSATVTPATVTPAQRGTGYRPPLQPSILPPPASPR